MLCPGNICDIPYGLCKIAKTTWRERVWGGCVCVWMHACMRVCVCLDNDTRIYVFVCLSFVYLFVLFCCMTARDVDHTMIQIVVQVMSLSPLFIVL